MIRALAGKFLGGGGGASRPPSRARRARRAGRVLLAVLATVPFGSCHTTRVKRVDPETVTDVTGRWNDTDSRLVAQEMIQDCLGSRWLQRWGDEHGGTLPRVIVGRVKNASHEHIDPTSFIKDLERELLNSGDVAFVAAKGEREGIREEREDQSRFASDETFAGFGLEKAADFMLIGTITDFVDEAGGRKVKAYQVDLELVAIATNQKVWINSKKIKKDIHRNRFGW